METWCRICFDKICREYALKFEMLRENEFVLIGKQFLISFCWFRDERGVYYIRRNEQGELERWNLEMHVRFAGKKVKPQKIFAGETGLEIRKNDIFSYAKTMEHCFGEMLSGGTAWMEEYMKKWYAEVDCRLFGIERQCAKQNHI